MVITHSRVVEVERAIVVLKDIRIDYGISWIKNGFIFKAQEWSGRLVGNSHSNSEILKIVLWIIGPLRAVEHIIFVLKFINLWRPEMLNIPGAFLISVINLPFILPVHQI